jgi:hypothetical protein
MASTTSTRTPKPQAPEFPRVTEESHQILLNQRGFAMKGFAKGEITAETKNAARKAVRVSREQRAAWAQFDQEMAEWKASQPKRTPRAKAETKVPVNA